MNTEPIWLSQTDSNVLYLLAIGFLLYLAQKWIREILTDWDKSVQRTVNNLGNTAKGVVTELEAATKRVSSHSATEAENVLNRVAEKAKDPEVKETVAHLAVIAAGAVVLGLLIADSDQRRKQ